MLIDAGYTPMRLTIISRRPSGEILRHLWMKGSRTKSLLSEVISLTILLREWFILVAWEQIGILFSSTKLLAWKTSDVDAITQDIFMLITSES